MLGIHSFNETTAFIIFSWFCCINIGKCNCYTKNTKDFEEYLWTNNFSFLKVTQVTSKKKILENYKG